MGSTCIASAMAMDSKIAKPRVVSVPSPAVRADRARTELARASQCLPEVPMPAACAGVHILHSVSLHIRAARADALKPGALQPLHGGAENSSPANRPHSPGCRNA